MWYEKDSKVINAELIEDIDSDLFFEHHYLEPIKPSNRIIDRDFLIERKESFYISGIQFHAYKDIYLDYKNFGIEHYNGRPLKLKPEPWNEYDSNAIAIQLWGSKLGYIERGKTRAVWEIMTNSKQYHATFDCSAPGLERVDIVYFEEFKDKAFFRYQTDMILVASCPDAYYEECSEFVKANKHHAITFDSSYKKGLIAIMSDMYSIIGYINDLFIEHQHLRASLCGYIDDVLADDKNKIIEIRLRLLMKKRIIDKKYQKEIKALSTYFNTFYEAGTYNIPLTDLVKIVPSESRSLAAYEPLVKYLKEYHAIHLIIE